MEKNRLTWKLGGKAGEGIMATGIIFSQSCSRGGLHVFDINEYPSLIKGGHNTVQVRVEDREIFSQVKEVNVLIWSVLRMATAMASGCVISYMRCEGT